MHRVRRSAVMGYAIVLTNHSQKVPCFANLLQTLSKIRASLSITVWNLCHSCSQFTHFVRQFDHVSTNLRQVIVAKLVCHIHERHIDSLLIIQVECSFICLVGWEWDLPLALEVDCVQQQHDGA